MGYHHWLCNGGETTFLKLKQHGYSLIHLQGMTHDRFPQMRQAQRGDGKVCIAMPRSLPVAEGLPHLCRILTGKRSCIQAMRVMRGLAIPRLVAKVKVIP